MDINLSDFQNFLIYKKLNFYFYINKIRKKKIQSPKMNDLYKKNVKLLSIINDALNNQNYNYTVKLLEKQFNNKKLFSNFLNNYDIVKTEVNRDGYSLYNMEIIVAVKLLLYFKTLNLINDKNVELIETVLNNLSLFIRFVFTSIDSKEYSNITNNCKEYIHSNFIINLNKKTDPQKNTVENISDKQENTEYMNAKNDNRNENPVDLKNPVINKNTDNKCNNSDIKIKTDIIESSEESNDVDLENTVEDNEEIINHENTDFNNNSDILKNTVETKKPLIDENTPKSKSENTPKRNRYKKTDKIEKIKNTVNNIINYNIKNKEIYEQTYRFNRSNIILFSNIYKQYKIDCILDNTEFENIYKSFDKNKNRFLKICKIYYEIYNEERLFNSKLLFLPYCFNEISIKDKYVNLLKTQIIEFLNNNKT